MNPNLGYYANVVVLQDEDGDMARTQYRQAIVTCDGQTNKFYNPSRAPACPGSSRA